MKQYEKDEYQAYLDSEKATIKGIKKAYEDALEQVDEKIRVLSTRTDIENMPTIIHQQKYQLQLKEQLEGILDKLQEKQYKTVNDYLNECYSESFLRTMYSLNQQGIPFVWPIDQKAVQRAVVLDSKISGGLYTNIGVDVQSFKKSISSEISRGIASSLSYSEIARNLKNASRVPISNASRIVRTEGHRIQNQAKLDTMNEAKKKGADVVKQWDSTLDGKTRDTHRKLDGQIREIDEDFEVDGMHASAPGQFGDPAEDCNCRCTCLTRARWALDESELETLKERAEYFGLDKTDDFNDFKEKYLNAANNVDEGADSGSVRSDVQKIDTNYAKASDVFLNGDDVPKGVSITPDQIINNLETSDVGKEALDYITSNGIKPQLIYEPQNHSNRGEQVGNSIKIFMTNIPSERVAAQTIIHEITHKKYNIGGCQWAEAVCMAKEKMHKEGRNYLTNDEKRYIVKLAKSAYPEYNWKKGGYKGGKRF